MIDGQRRVLGGHTRTVPRNYPQRPDYSEPGFAAERQVWEGLQGLPDNAVVIAQYRVLDSRRVTREADFLVMIPDVGIGVVEVKGGRVWTQDAQWFSRDRTGRDHAIHHPIQQASRVGYALRDFVGDQGGGFPDWVPVAVLPDTSLPSWFQPADSLRRQWLDGTVDLSARISAAIYTDAAPSQAEVDALVELLEQRLPRPVAWERAHDAKAHADMLTRDQYAILRAIRTNDRILVTGGPGTGKTWLALEHARQEAIHGARVCILCYNRGLALHMISEADSWPEDQRPAYVGTLHQLALDWTGISVPPEADSKFWDGLPALLESAADERADDERFDVLIVDEAQDFAADWWPCVRALLNDPQSGPMVVFGDDDQELYGRGALGVPAVEVALTENVRNTVQIAAVLEQLSGQPQQCRGATGPEVVFLPAPEERVLEVADEAVVALLTGGEFRAMDIALLTTHRRHPEHVERLARLGPLGFADSLFATDEVAVCTVKGFKGLERPAVVLAVNGFHEQDDEATLLRVGVSRATHQLVVVGGSDWWPGPA